MNENYRHGMIFVVAALLLSWSGLCAAQATDNPANARISQPVSVADLLDSSPRAMGEYHVMAGEIALSRREDERAVQAYLKALDSVSDPVLAKRTMQIALAIQRPKLAYRAARVRADALPDDLKAQATVVRLAFIERDKPGLEHFAVRLVDAAKNPRDGYKVLTQVLGDKPDRATLALQTVQSLVQLHPADAGANYALALLALKYGHPSLASKAAEKATDGAPEWNDAALLAAQIEVLQGQYDAAEKRVDALPGSDRERSGYRVFLARALLKAGQDKAGKNAFGRAVAIDPDNDAARFGYGLVALTHNDLDIAETQFKVLRGKKIHVDDTAFFLGIVAERRDHDKAAMQWYKQVGGGQHVFDAKVRMARLIYEMGDLHKSLAQLHHLARDHPDQRSRLSMVEGGILVRAGRGEDALKVYDHALQAAPNDHDLRYSRALAYAELGRASDAESDLKKLLDANPDDAEALNALGYILTNHSTDYVRAEKFIRKALTLKPGTPAMLDSLGWVEYKLGHLNQALGHLEQAYKASPGPEIAAHLGEVRWQLGDHEAARKVWNKAAREHPHNKVLEQTIKRFAS